MYIPYYYVFVFVFVRSTRVAEITRRVYTLASCAIYSTVAGGLLLRVATTADTWGNDSRIITATKVWEWTNFEFWQTRRHNWLLFRLNLISFLYPRIISACGV